MLNLLRIYAFVLAALPSLAHAILYGGYAKQECYSALDGWQSMGSSPTQTAGTCGGQCSDAGFPLFGLSGSECYCGSAYPSSSAQTNSGSCSVPCNSYPSDTCGGSGAFVVYSINGKQASSAPASSAQSSTQSSSQSSAASSETTSASSSSTAPATDSTSSASSSAANTPSSSVPASTTQSSSSDATSATPSSTASDESSSQSSSSAQTVTVTASSSSTSPSPTSQSSSATPTSTSASSSTSAPTSTPSSTPSSSAASKTSASRASSSSAAKSTSTLDPKDKSASGHHGVSGGAIAGIVVGVVAGVVIIAGLLLLLCLRWRKRDREDEYYSPSASPDDLKSSIGSFNNPYPQRPVVDQRLNPAMLGDPRISIASLADARDYSRQILKVANPDEKSII